MKSKARTWLLPLLALCAGAASAQDASLDPQECPAFPTEAQDTYRWDAMRVPGILVCRAMLREGGQEAFALTMSRESPFRPRRSDRAETGTLNGREVQWYRGVLPNEPNALIRETLIRTGEERVVHVYMRAADPESLARHQQAVLSLPLSVYEED